jgi:hypothetical protein
MSDEPSPEKNPLEVFSDEQLLEELARRERIRNIDVADTELIRC